MSRVVVDTSAIAKERKDVCARMSLCVCVCLCERESVCSCICAPALFCKQAVKFNYLPPPLLCSVGVPAERGSASTEPFPWETLAHSG